MSIPKPACIDFETIGIDDRPNYPPAPVGVSIKPYGKLSKYYAWGHASGNNCSWGEAREALRQVWLNDEGILFQHGKFDIDVAEVHMGLPPPSWDKVHDTLFLLFLDDPNQQELGLKPSAQRLLGLAPDEQDAVSEWLITNQPIPGIKISRSKASGHYFGRYVAYAPGELVGQYAVGDTDRAAAVFELLWPKTEARGMLEAYDRERELVRILLEMERNGIRVDLKRLRHDVDAYTYWQGEVDQWVIKALKAPKTINLNSGDELMAAMVAAGKVDEEAALRTKTGKLQTNKDALLKSVSDTVLLSMLRYRAALKTCIGTFMAPWLEMAEQSDGLIFTSWNQTKSAEGSGAIGTRTGRLSATWFMNIPKEFDQLWKHEAAGKPKCPLKDLPQLPQVRGYIIPYEPDHVLIDRDFCFGPGTDILTDRGFVKFEELSHGDLVAQWAQGEVTYMAPKAYQINHFKGELVNIVGERSTDLLVTPNHQCLMVKDHQTIFVRADEYRLGHFQQPHAGTYIGKFDAKPEHLKILAAIQADSTLKSSAVVWKLKKVRKVERLTTLLAALGWAYSISSPPSAVGYSLISVHFSELPEWVNAFIDLTNGKTFRRSLLQASPQSRLAFLMELAHWDGRRQESESNWSYFSTNEANAELVQEMAAVTGVRAIMHKQTLPSGKVFSTVAMRTNYLTWTKTYSLTKVPYEGPTYCVTMPEGTVIVRRNGRVMVTGNSQQEPRILAHFDGGALMEKYLENPWVDFHDYAKAELEKVGKFYERKPVKNTNLGLIYGMGAGKLAERNNMSVEEASELKKAILQLYPGLKEMYKDMKVRAAQNLPVKTWGGREYYCETPKLVDGRMMEFSYKLPNALIQGSAADCTKEAILRFSRSKKPAEKLILNVHDQLTASVPVKAIMDSMERLRVAMEGIEFDVPMLSEGSWSDVSWGDLIDYDKKGVLIYGEKTKAKK